MAFDWAEKITMDELKKPGELKAAGILTEEEFQKRKRNTIEQLISNGQF
jgi:hypothetical protein